MPALQQNATIVSKSEIAAGIFDMQLACPALVACATCGQFVHIRVPGRMLRRPISICAINKAHGTLRIVFEVRGDGTRDLAAFEVGQEFNLLGPLGNGFALPEHAHVVAVGGGIGVPPMLALAQHYGKQCTAITGFRNASAVILEQDFIRAEADLRLCTDDGSRGAHGFVTTQLEQRLSAHAADIIYACGPTAMLKGVAELAKRFGVRCQLSLEERMACGVGTCLGCACKTRGKGDAVVHQHVCKNGPVFEAEEVVL